MKEIPAEIRVLYDALLVQEKIPEKLRVYYTKCLRYYPDYCSNSARGRQGLYSPPLRTG